MSAISNICEQCSRSFSKKANLVRHCRQFHGLAASERCFLCPLCGNEVGKDLFPEHCESLHDLTIDHQRLSFNNSEDFRKWKEEIERETCAFFIKSFGKKHTSKGYTQIFICNRSGELKSRSKGLRELRERGSRKCGKFCPASIKLSVDNDGKHSVIFCSSHIGHQNVPEHLNLPKKDREELIKKLEIGVSKTRVLDDLREEVNFDEMRPIDLVQDKNLSRICDQYGINNANRSHSIDSVSVESWVTTRMSENPCIILIFKNRDEDDPSGKLERDDFMLAIMTPNQENMLRKFGKKCLTIDSTHGISMYKIQLTTLMVLDEEGHGYPAAFCYSNRTDADLMSVFFSKIKDKIPDLSTKIFMSDDAASYYNAFRSVFSEPDHRLICAWHVKNSWLRNWGKIHDQELRIKTKEKLEEIYQEPNEAAFELKLDSFIDEISSDERLKEYADYFIRFYSNRRKQWAMCYRKGLHLNTNMHLENMHRRLKHIYMEGRKVKRLDKSITILMRMLRDFNHQRVVKLRKGYSGPKLTRIRRSHEASKKIVNPLINCVDEKGEYWCIQSTTSGTDIYEIRMDNSSCDCQLRCKYCQLCLHAMSCTCPDYLGGNLCKHIHYWKSKQSVDEKLDDDKDNRLSIITSSERDEEARNAAQDICLIARNSALSVKKRELCDLINAKIHSLNSPESLRNFEQGILGLIGDSPPSSQEFIKSKEINLKRKIERQRRFLSVKKSRKNYSTSGSRRSNNFPN